jgi:predicted SnoaL-like aldol condensation-catalyzing enzyme
MKIVGRLLAGIALAGASWVAVAADAVDVTGTWQLTVQDTGRVFKPSFTMTQKGDQLTGTYKNSQGDNPASGSVKGNEVTLNAQITGQDGNKRTVTYVGTVVDDTMTGKLQTTRPGVTFVARRNATEEANKKLVQEFYDKALNQKDFEAAAKYLGAKYVQHNPRAADGPEGLKAYLEFLKGKFPKSRSEIKRVFAEGDHVILHVHAVREPGTKGQAIIDIFRVDNGKIVEHWDVVQDVPDQALNTNTMF